MDKKANYKANLENMVNGVLFGLGTLAGAAAAAYVFVLVDRK